MATMCRTREGPVSAGTHRIGVQAFTMLELMLVVALIGILMAVAAYSLMGQGERGRVTATRASLMTIRTALDQYNLTHGRYPPSLALLQSGPMPLLDPARPLKDAWKNDFLYVTPGREGRAFELYSKGPNGVFENGGGDDLDIWRILAEPPSRP